MVSIGELEVNLPVHVLPLGADEMKEYSYLGTDNSGEFRYNLKISVQTGQRLSIKVLPLRDVNSEGTIRTFIKDAVKVAGTFSLSKRSSSSNCTSLLGDKTTTLTDSTCSGLKHTGVYKESESVSESLIHASQDDSSQQKSAQVGHGANCSGQTSGPIGGVLVKEEICDYGYGNVDIGEFVVGSYEKSDYDDRRDTFQSDNQFAKDISSDTLMSMSKSNISAHKKKLATKKVSRGKRSKSKAVVVELRVARSTEFYRRKRDNMKDAKRYNKRTGPTLCGQCHKERDSATHKQYFGRWHCSDTSLQLYAEWRAERGAEYKAKKNTDT